MHCLSAGIAVLGRQVGDAGHRVKVEPHRVGRLAAWCQCPGEHGLGAVAA